MRRKLVSWTFVLVGVTLAASPASAQTQKLKTAVTLSGATATDTLDWQVAPGPLSRELDFYPTTALEPSPAAARLAVTNLRATTAPGDAAIVKAGRADGSVTASDGAMFDVELKVGEPVRIRVSAEGLRAGAIYKGRIILQAIKETREWEVTVTTGAKPVLVVDAVPALQFQRSVWGWVCSWWGCDDPLGEFSVSLRGKTPIANLTGLQPRFEPGAVAATKTLRSNFSISNFSFGPGRDPLAVSPPATDASANPAKPAASPAAAPQPASSADAKVDPCGTRGTPLPSGTLDKPIWITTCLLRLEPGEYAGTLRFVANEVSEDAAESRVALAVNVRDSRAIPIAVLILGSSIGWFTTKYLAAARKARDLARTVGQLRDRADHLTRTKSGAQGWGFSDEAVSSALMKVRVTLNRLAKLTKGGLPMLVQEAELTRLKDDAEARLAKLEALRAARVAVELTASIRPTIQKVVGRLLRECSDLLDQPAFGADHKATFDERLEQIKKWASAEMLLATYRKALVDRSARDRGAVHSSDFAAEVREHIDQLLASWPLAEAISAADAGDAKLHQFDEAFETLALLNRDRNESWGAALAQGSRSNESLHKLFELVDKAFWKKLVEEAANITIAADRPTVDCYDLVRAEVSVPGIKRTRLLVHPLHFVWTIKAPSETRVVETEDLILVQFFSEPESATISLQLRWGAEPPIDVATKVTVDVRPNRDYRNSQIVYQGGMLEYIAVAFAILFAVVTAMQAQYDSTFGSTSQYLALFIWAAGVASGGNVLKQLGTSSNPGGQADATLPAKT